MAVVLDTVGIDPRDRADVLADVALQESAPAYIEHAARDDTLYGRFEAWNFGAVNLLRVEVSGLSLVRTPKQVRVSPSPHLALVLKRQGVARYSIGETQYEATPGRLFLFEFNQPYNVDWGRGGETFLRVPLDLLDLPIESVRRALVRLPASPLYPLVTNQVAAMADCADTLEIDAAARELGDACVEMTRALVASAAALGTEDGAALPRQILLTRIREYIRRNLADPELDAARIAHAHNISLRYLYKLCAEADLGLAQWIIRQRLERSRAELARPTDRHRSIAAIAYGCGFRDPTHFTRRFRAAYGLTPTDWRRTALGGSSPTAPPNVEEQPGVLLRFPLQS